MSTTTLLITTEALAALRANGIEPRGRPLGDLFAYEAPARVAASLALINPDPSAAILKMVGRWVVFRSEPGADQCPGPPADAGPLMRRYTEQWQAQGRAHWWRNDWEAGIARCKFCGSAGQAPRR